MLRVVCLCAEWCSACRAWRPDWDALAARHPQHRWQWLDIEDEPDLMDAVGLDIETFPTVLVAHEGRALFLGAVPPQQALFERCIRGQVVMVTGAAGSISCHPASVNCCPSCQ